MTLCYQPGRHFFSIAGQRFNLQCLTISQLALNDSPIFHLTVYVPKGECLREYLDKEAQIELSDDHSTTTLSGWLVSVRKSCALIDDHCYRYHLVLYGLLRYYGRYPASQSCHKQRLTSFLQAFFIAHGADISRLQCDSSLASTAVSFALTNCIAFDLLTHVLAQVDAYCYSIYEQGWERVICSAKLALAETVHELDKWLIKTQLNESLLGREYIVEIAQGGVLPGEQVVVAGILYRVQCVSVQVSTRLAASVAPLFIWRLSLKAEAEADSTPALVMPAYQFSLARVLDKTQLYYDFNEEKSSQPILFKQSAVALQPALNVAVRLNPQQKVVTAAINGQLSRPLVIGTLDESQSDAPKAQYELMQDGLVFSDSEACNTFGPKTLGNYMMMNRVGQYWINEQGEMSWTVGAELSLKARRWIRVKACDVLLDFHRSLTLAASQGDVQVNAAGNIRSQAEKQVWRSVNFTAKQHQLELLSEGNIRLSSLRVNFSASHTVMIAKTVTIETNHALFSTRRTTLRLTDSGIYCRSGLCLLEGGIQVISV